MEIKLKIGISNLVFGMTQKDVIQILGNPDENRFDKDDDNKLIYVYYKQKMRLTFYVSENNRLGYIESANEKLTFNKFSVINTEVKTAKENIFGQAITDWEIEDYNSFSTHFNEKFWFTLHIEYGIVSDIEIGVPLKTEEDYDWPKLENYGV